MATRSTVRAAATRSVSHPNFAWAIGLAFMLVGASACSSDPDDPGPGTGGSGAAGTGGDPGTGGTGGAPGTGGTGGAPGTGGTGGDPGTGGTGGDPGTGGIGGDPGTGGTGGDPGTGGTGGDPGTGGTGGDPGEGGTGGDPGTGGTGGIAGEGGAGGDGGIEDPEPVVVRVEIDPGAVSISELSGSNLVATAFDAADQPIPSLPVSWRSSNPSVVSVTAFGNVFGNRVGTETITATIEGIEGEATVTVTPGVIVGVFVYGLPSKMNQGDTAYLSAAAVDAQDRSLPGRTATWSSSDPAVATVDASGVLTALAVGTTTVTAEVEGVQGSAEVEVVAPAAAGTSMAMGLEHTCYLDGAGEVWCWGDNLQGQLGIGITGTAEYVPVRAAPGMYFKSIAAGEYHTCGVDMGSQVYCWGRNADRQLGNTAGGNSPTPLLVTSDPYEFVGTQYRGVCAADPQGHPWCWGFNSSDHELGNPTTSSSAVPMEVSAPAGGVQLEVVELRGGWYHTCALTTDARLFCWGYNNSGQLGNGNNTSSALPVEVFLGSTVDTYAVGQHYACAISAGATYCWGQNNSGALGISGSSNVNTPNPVLSGGSTFVALACGESHTCAIDDVGQAWCWGSNASGQLGRPGGDSSTPVQVDGGLTFVSIHARKDQTCAESSDGSLYCWGSNASGRLGIGQSFAQVDSPTAVQW